jgi:hypothetical protein
MRAVCFPGPKRGPLGFGGFDPFFSGMAVGAAAAIAGVMLGLYLLLPV